MEQRVKEQIANELNIWIDSKNPERSANKLSQKSGVNIAYIVAIRKGEFKVGTTEISDKMFRKLAECVGYDLEDNLHWETANFKFIQRVCRKFQNNKKIGLLHSDESGWGKTYALEHYCQRNDQALYIKCTSLMSGKDLLTYILHRLQIKSKLTGNKAKMDAITDKVIRPGFLIVIDEAECVKPGVYDVIKDIADATHNKCGLLVSGMRLDKKIEKLADKGRQGFPQLRRRLFANKAVINGLSKGEIVTICESHDIVIKTAHNWFINNVKDFQTLSEYIKDALKVSEKTGKQIDGEFLIDLFSNQ